MVRKHINNINILNNKTTTPACIHIKVNYVNVVVTLGIVKKPNWTKGNLSIITVFCM